MGVAHIDAEIGVIKRSSRLLMEQLRADRMPQMELFTHTEYADLQELVRKAPRPEQLDAKLGDCCKETRLSLGFLNVMGTVYGQLGWVTLLGGRRKSANRMVRELGLGQPVAAGE